MGEISEKVKNWLQEGLKIEEVTLKEDELKTKGIVLISLAGSTGGRSSSLSMRKSGKKFKVYVKRVWGFYTPVSKLTSQADSCCILGDDNKF